MTGADQVEMPSTPRKTGPRLRVMEARLEDVEHGIVRVAETTLHLLGMDPGEVVLLEGLRKSLARVWPLDPDDEHPSIIQMDGLTRENTGISLDDRIQIQVFPVAPLSTLLLCPADQVTLGPSEVRRIRESLVGRAVMAGDKINIPLFSRKGMQFQVMAFEMFSQSCLARLAAHRGLRSPLEAEAPVYALLEVEAPHRDALDG